MTNIPTIYFSNACNKKQFRAPLITLTVSIDKVLIPKAKHKKYRLTDGIKVAMR
jgi:hypothetical protein